MGFFRRKPVSIIRNLATDGIFITKNDENAIKGIKELGMWEQLEALPTGISILGSDENFWFVATKAKKGEGYDSDDTGYLLSIFGKDAITKEELTKVLHESYNMPSEYDIDL